MHLHLRMYLSLIYTASPSPQNTNKAVVETDIVHLV
jgi:hypothetical protein